MLWFGRKIRTWIIVGLAVACFMPTAMASGTFAIQGETFDLAVLISSLLAFVFDCLFRILNWVDEGLLRIATGNFDVPFFGAWRDAMEQAGMIDYRFPETPGIGFGFTQSAASVCLWVTGRLRDFFIILEQYVEAGVVTDWLHGVFSFFDENFGKYEIFRALGALFGSLVS